MMSGLQEYKKVDLNASVQTASPHQLVTMLMQGGIGALAMASGAIERKDLGARSMQINKAISIIFELKESLDIDKGGELAANLDSLYDYMNRTLIEANRENSLEKVQEVGRLMGEILDGWQQIPPEYRKQQD